MLKLSNRNSKRKYKFQRKSLRRKKMTKKQYRFRRTKRGGMSFIGEGVDMWNKARSRSVSLDLPIKREMSFDLPIKREMSFDLPIKRKMSFDLPIKREMSFDLPIKNDMNLTKRMGEPLVRGALNVAGTIFGAAANTALNATGFVANAAANTALNAAGTVFNAAKNALLTKINGIKNRIMGIKSIDVYRITKGGLFSNDKIVSIKLTLDRYILKWDGPNPGKIDIRNLTDSYKIPDTYKSSK